MDEGDNYIDSFAVVCLTVVFAVFLLGFLVGRCSRPALPAQPIHITVSTPLSATTPAAQQTSPPQSGTLPAPSKKPGRP